jgi:hypothetical protein
MSSSIGPFFEWLNGTPLATGIRESAWWYPILELIHSLGIILVLGTIWMVDLRLLGVGMRSRRVTEVAGRLLPWTWLGFGIQLISGVLLTLSEAARIYPVPYFWIKLALLVLVGANAAIFHAGVYRTVEDWDNAAVTPLRARIAGGMSLVLWTGVIAAGRAIGYVI